jgi:hypothetical protein
MPLQLKPFVSGLFFPLLFLMFFNYNIIANTISQDALKVFIMLTLFFYALVAIRGSGTIKTEKNRKKT